MLRIRPEQAEHLAEAFRSRFEQRLSAPERPWPAPGEAPTPEQRLAFEYLLRA